MINNVQERNREIDWIVPFLVGANVITIPREQKLLPAPVEMPKSRVNSTNFDQKLEAEYLSNLPEDMRVSQLQKEVVTALSEIRFSQFGANYVIDNGRLVDVDTGLDLESLIAKGKISAETEAIKKINKYFNNGAEMVVNISPADKELGYLDNMVDVWIRCADEKIRVLRNKSVGDYSTFVNFYEYVGGKIVKPTKDQILADPINVEKLKLSEVLDLLVIEKCEAKFTTKDIDRIAGAMMRDFENKFGDRLTRDPNVIIRYYLAVKTEVDKLGKNISVKEIDRIVDDVIKVMPVDRYLNANFRVKNEAGGGCASTTPGGEFGGGQGWILVVVDGRMTAYFGSTEGMSHCERCGCYHPGTSCPYCDLGYAATC